MGKVQKTLMVNEDIHALVEAIEKRTGATFARIVHAALIQYLFSGFESIDPNAVPGPMSIWMKIAYGVEKGEIAVDDIPDEIIEGCLQDASMFIARYDCDNPSANEKARLKEWRDIHRAFGTRKVRWNRKVKDMGGKLEAMIYQLEGKFTTKPPEKK